VRALTFDQEKRLANAIVAAAFAGITVHKLEDDRGALELVASRSALTRCFRGPDCIAQLESWLGRVAGPARAV
jgi:hypothetical protein